VFSYLYSIRLQRNYGNCHDGPPPSRPAPALARRLLNQNYYICSSPSSSGGGRYCFSLAHLILQLPSDLSMTSCPHMMDPCPVYMASHLQKTQEHHYAAQEQEILKNIESIHFFLTSYPNQLDRFYGVISKTDSENSPGGADTLQEWESRTSRVVHGSGPSSLKPCIA